MAKLLTVVIPCYNSEDYMDHCVRTILPGGDSVEIIIVDDGSTDRTGAIADHLSQAHPTIIKVIHQPNGGHGAAVNTGVQHASGRYVKIVDSDDWLDAKAYPKVLGQLRKFDSDQLQIDMMITNFIYDKVGSRHKKLMSYRLLPTNRVFSWRQFRPRVGHYLLMHSVIYRTTLLRDQVHLSLPRHCFYVDNLYVFEPLLAVKKIYYLNVPLYHYFIGRKDQSVNEDVMLKRIDQQLAVNRRMIDFYVDHVDPRTHVGRYMRSYLEIITTISSIVLVRGGQPAHLAKRDALWNYMKARDPKLYRRLRHRIFGAAVNVSGKVGRKTTMELYEIARKLYGFN